jgi:tRNA threonylcarbamoyladenosine biosynthesis protein TsaE
LNWRQAENMYNCRVTSGTTSLELQTHSAADTQALGLALGRLLWPGAIVCLEGDLGAGKTCLTQGLGQGLGIDEPIISPTFTLIREYRGRLPLFHVDCYRLSDPADAWALGLDDYLYGDGVTVVEWADRVQALIPADRLWIRLEYLDGDARRVTLTAGGERYQACLDRLPLPWPDPA